MTLLIIAAFFLLDVAAVTAGLGHLSRRRQQIDPTDMRDRRPREEWLSRR
jgi:hypothetical protein